MRSAIIFLGVLVLSAAVVLWFYPGGSLWEVWRGVWTEYPYRDYSFILGVVGTIIFIIGIYAITRKKKAERSSIEQDSR